jgi:hypothetical protein
MAVYWSDDKAPTPPSAFPVPVLHPLFALAANIEGRPYWDNKHLTQRQFIRSRAVAQDQHGDGHLKSQAPLYVRRSGMVQANSEMLAENVDMVKNAALNPDTICDCIAC